VAVAFRRLSTARLWQLAAACWITTLVAPAVYSAFDPDGFGRPLESHDNALYAWYLKFFPVHHFPEFIAGVAIGVLWSRRPSMIDAHRSIALILGALAALGFVVTTGWIPHAYVHSGALTPVFLAVIVGFAVPSRFATAVAWVPVTVLGRASYAIYILHVPLFLLMARFDPVMWTAPGHGLPLYAVTLFGVSLAAHAWIEQPCRRLLVRRLAEPRRSTR
jgi:peptidoglycan/LPS O-acetylase OafA/YrhL